MKSTFLTGILFLLFFIHATQGRSEIEYINSYGGIVRGFLIHDKYAYLSQRDLIRIYDMRDKSRVHEVGAFHDPWTTIGKMEIKYPVIFYTSHLIGSYYEGINAVNIIDPIQPRKVDYLDYFPLMYSKGRGVEWMIRGSRLYANSPAHSSCIYDISDPLKIKVIQDEEEWSKWHGSISDIPTKSNSIPSSIRELIYSGCIQGVKAEGNLVYVEDRESNVKMIDVSDPKTPKCLGAAKNQQMLRTQIESMRTSPTETILIGKKYEIAVHYYQKGEEDHHRLMIRDISDPYSPRLVNYLDDDEWSTDRTLGLWLSNHLLYQFTRHHNTGGGLYSMSIYDLNDPEKPKKLGATPYPLDEHFGFEEIPDSISINGKMIYVANGNNGMAILRFGTEKKDR